MMKPDPTQRELRLMQIASRLRRIRKQHDRVITERNRLIIDSLEKGEIGVTRLARATNLTTTAIYKIRDRARESDPRHIA